MTLLSESIPPMNPFSKKPLTLKQKERKKLYESQKKRYQEAFDKKVWTKTPTSDVEEFERLCMNQPFGEVREEPQKRIRRHWNARSD